MSSSRTSLAIAVATLAFTYSASSLADEPQVPPSKPPDTSATEPLDTTSEPAETSTSTSTTTTTDASKTPATTTTTQAAYDPSAGAEQREEIRPNVRVLVPSALVFLGAYGTSAIVGSINDRDSDHDLAIPLVGPWLDLADRNCDVNPCDHEALSKTAIVASGVLQAVGLAGVVASFFIPETRTTRAAVAKPHVNVLPVSIGRGGAGVGAVGVF